MPGRPGHPDPAFPADARASKVKHPPCGGIDMKSHRMLLALALVATTGAAAESHGLDTFETLKSLQGHWRPDIQGSSTTVEFRLTAGGSALVETWTMGQGRESMTIYTMDGDHLVATHYCPQGNAPSLRHIGSDEESGHHFQFVDGLNVQIPGRSHVHAFSLKLVDRDTIERSETYIANGTSYQPGTHGIDRYRFVRIVP
jgi:hypothetical protein